MKVLPSLGPSDDEVSFSISTREFWEQLLFEYGFSAWLIDHVIERNFNWTRIIRDLHSGEVIEGHGNSSHYVPKDLQQLALRLLTIMGMKESENTMEREHLGFSLLLDGLEVGDGKLVSIEGPISVTEEKNRVAKNLAASSFARKTLIQKHLKDAEDHFSNGQMHSAMGESRSAFQASIEDTVSLLEKKLSARAGGGVKNQIEFLAREKLISDDEQQAFLAAWGFLSAGAHPGLPPDEAGRIGFIFGLEFTQVLLLKAKSLM